MFEGPEKEGMAAQKEKQFTVRMDEETYNWLVRESGEMDVDRSKIIRAACMLAIHQIKAIPSLINIQLKDIQKD